MRTYARRPTSAILSVPLVMLLLACPLVAQQQLRRADDDQRSASEILAAAAEEAAQHSNNKPPGPPAPPTVPDVEPTTIADSPQQPPPTATPPTVDAGDQPPPVASPTGPARASIDPVSFQGVRPGHTTREELHEEWGQPQQVERIPGGARETYPSEAFEHMRVTVLEDVVDSLTLKLKQPMAIDAIVEKLHVIDVEPVEVFDDKGRLLGQAYPERGMLFGFDARFEQPQVSWIVIEPIGEGPFLARAEIRLRDRYEACRADIEQARRLAPDHGRTYWLEAELTLRAGDVEAAINAARKAIELAPQELDYRLTLAKALSAAADHRQAIQHARDVVETAGASPITRAKAYCRLGDCVAAAPQRDYRQAADHHMQAAKLAAGLAKSEIVAIRRAAKDVLLRAYLGAARDIGQGRWRQKSQVVPKWLESAMTVADEIIQHERGSAEARLRVYEAALAALAGIADPPDATTWIDGAGELGGVLVEQAADPAYKAHLAWRLGVALSDAVEIETARGQFERATQLGNIAMAYFAKGEPAAKALPTHDYLRGWLCYRLGAIRAVEHDDHAQAVAWFGHAVPLLESPVPPSSVVNPARHGETFVSMAISYWEQGDRQEALRLTEQGLQLMEQASLDGHLEKSALAVPYGNLSRMHELLGDADSARQFETLAARAEALAPK